MKIKRITLIFLLTCMLTACGTNIFQNTPSKDTETLNDLLDNATSSADYQEIIDKSTTIINDPETTDMEKKDAHFSKAESILGKNEASALDLFQDMSAAIDNNSNPINSINFDIDINELISASSSVATANKIASSNNDQDLLQGVINTMIVTNTIKDIFDIDKDGNIEQKTKSDTYFQSLEKLISPPEFPTGKTIIHYSQDAINGLVNAESLSTDQEEKANKVNTAITNANTLFETVRDGGSYDGLTFIGVGSGGTPSTTELTNLEEKLESIFKEI